MRWDESGLVYRYVSRDKASIAVAMGPVPFRIGEGFFPPHMGLIWQAVGWGIFLLAAIIIILAGTFLVRRMSRDIIQPLTDLQRSAHRIGQGDYDTPVQSHGTDELGETAAVLKTCADNCRLAVNSANSMRRIGRNSLRASHTIWRRL